MMNKPEFESNLMDFTVFFTYEHKGDSMKTMAIVKAENQKEASNKVQDSLDKEEYKNFKIWWTEELNKMYDGKDIIIP